MVMVLAIAAAIGGGFWLSRERAARDRERQEALLRTQLASMRTAIKRYTAKHHSSPHALRDAMPNVPTDPVTHSAATWKTTTEEAVTLDDFTATSSADPRGGGIVDVHSGASGRDSHGRAWSEY
jgi:type II secretory pathway pseudopilin PulG